MKPHDLPLTPRPRQRLGPGLYLTGNQLELDCPELLRHFGFPDTPENRDLMVREAIKLTRRLYPGVPQYVTTDEQPLPTRVGEG